MTNPIVCGIDRSAGASRAAAVASRLAEHLGSPAGLVHVDGEPPNLASLARARELRELRRVGDAYAFPRFGPVRVAGGDPASELARLARELDAELLVVGSCGRRELGSAVLGSVAADLIRQAPCPVVVVPPNATLPSQLEAPSIVCGVEGTARDRDVVLLADDLRRRFCARLHVVHAFDPNPAAAGAAGVAPPLMPELEDTAHPRLSRVLRESGVDADPEVVRLPAGVALLQVAEEHEAALIVVGCHGRGRVANVLLGSVSIQLAAEASCPVVVLPPGARLAPGSGNYEVTREAV